MKLCVCLFALVAAIVIVECTHTFYGSNTFGRLVFHKDVKYGANRSKKRFENITYTLPSTFEYEHSTIQGILAYDLTKSGAKSTATSANVTTGGLGYNYVTILLESTRGHPLHYDVSIYA